MGLDILISMTDKSVEVDIKGSGVVEVYGNPANFSKTIVGDGHVSIN